MFVFCAFRLSLESGLKMSERADRQVSAVADFIHDLRARQLLHILLSKYL